MGKALSRDFFTIRESTVADGLELSHQLLTNKTKRPWVLVGVDISESSHNFGKCERSGH